MHMIGGLNARYDLNARFCTGMADDLRQSFAHFAAQDLVAISGDPDDVKPLMEFGMAAGGFAPQNGN